MLLYQTDDAGFWNGEVLEARQSPEEANVFLIPRGCIEAEPPALAQGERAQWSWEPEGWTVVPAADEPEAPPIVVPITRRQLRLTLLAHDLLALVEPAIQALPEPALSEAMIEWQDASEYRREHPLIAQIAADLGLDEPTVDAMWTEALAR